jgi:hypothetical protein
MNIVLTILGIFVIGCMFSGPLLLPVLLEGGMITTAAFFLYCSLG